MIEINEYWGSNGRVEGGSGGGVWVEKRGM